MFPSDAVFLIHPTSATTLWPTTGNGGWTGALDVNESTQLNFVEDEQVLELGGREIHVLHLGRAHTGGDLVVYVPQGKVLFMSETYLKGIFPAMRSAYPSEWVAMLERAEAMDVDVYVPGHGIMESPPILHHELVADHRFSPLPCNPHESLKRRMLFPTNGSHIAHRAQISGPKKD